MIQCKTVKAPSYVLIFWLQSIRSVCFGITFHLLNLFYVVFDFWSARVRSAIGKLAIAFFCFTRRPQSPMFNSSYNYFELFTWLNRVRAQKQTCKICFNLTSNQPTATMAWLGWWLPHRGWLSSIVEQPSLSLPSFVTFTYLKVAGSIPATGVSNSVSFLQKFWL